MLVESQYFICSTCMKVCSVLSLSSTTVLHKHSRSVSRLLLLVGSKFVCWQTRRTNGGQTDVCVLHLCKKSQDGASHLIYSMKRTNNGINKILKIPNLAEGRCSSWLTVSEWGGFSWMATSPLNASKCCTRLLQPTYGLVDEFTY